MDMFPKYEFFKLFLCPSEAASQFKSYFNLERTNPVAEGVKLIIIDSLTNISPSIPTLLGTLNSMGPNILKSGFIDKKVYLKSRSRSIIFNTSGFCVIPFIFI